MKRGYPLYYSIKSGNSRFLMLVFHNFIENLKPVNCKNIFDYFSEIIFELKFLLFLPPKLLPKGIILNSQLHLIFGVLFFFIST